MLGKSLVSHSFSSTNSALFSLTECTPNFRSEDSQKFKSLISAERVVSSEDANFKWAI